MREAPLISKRQLVGVTLLFLNLLIVNEVYKNSVILRLNSMLFICMLNITFLPYIKHKLNYSVWVQSFLYELPMALTFVFLQPKIREVNIKIIAAISIAMTMIVMLLGINDFIKNIKYQYILSAISKKSCVIKIIELVCKIGIEEVFFRGFIIDSLRYEIGRASILVSAIFFVYFHYANRWAIYAYNFKIYIMQFLLGIICGMAYYAAGLILIPILCHMLFDLSEFIILVKRTQVNKNIVDWNDI